MASRKGAGTPYRFSREATASSPFIRPTFEQSSGRTTFIFYAKKMLRFCGWGAFEYSVVSWSLLLGAVVFAGMHCIALGLCGGSCKWLIDMTGVFPSFLLIICCIRWTASALKRAFLPYAHSGERAVESPISRRSRETQPILHAHNYKRINDSLAVTGAGSGGGSAVSAAINRHEDSWVDTIDTVVAVPYTPGYIPFVPMCFQDAYSNFVLIGLLFALATDIITPFQGYDTLFLDFAIAAELASHLSYTVAFSSGGAPAHWLRAIPVFIVFLGIYLLLHFVFIVPVVVHRHSSSSALIDLPALVFLACDAALVWRAGARIGLTNNPFDRRWRQVWIGFAGSLCLVLSLMIQWVLSFEQSKATVVVLGGWVMAYKWLRWIAHGMITISVRPARNVGIGDE